ncbi:DUF2237 family protein [Algoriphagus sp.]|uniref:DUF2237 family protein n=1 Tax=Algoriphagus sp. TaxID=1872435 RepID=UPI00271CE67A|nr:DUF2237 domain-containing protein [Algoriphagus sp.]MDO8967644.1 DUF2237 domain-containing protein [Algoriphagus sp.]MDP3202163.1 DUF2237 domain-containing protein [Algoriphagus sp.]
MSKNVFGEDLISCSTSPMTGFYRNGCCETGPEDSGTHTVCAMMTEEFLLFSRSRGNDLITPRPEYQFPGLSAGDKWCLCALRWLEAYRSNCAPPVFLEATNEKTLKLIPLEILISKALKNTE